LFDEETLGDRLCSYTRLACDIVGYTPHAAVGSFGFRNHVRRIIYYILVKICIRGKSHRVVAAKAPKRLCQKSTSHGSGGSSGGGSN